MFRSAQRSHRSTSRVAVATLTAAALLALTGCGGDSGDAEAAGDVSLVATTTQLGSIASQLTDCAGGTTEILMDPSDDPHQFAVSSQQVVSMVQADLVVANGLNLEASMRDSLRNAESDGATIVYAAEYADPLAFGSSAQDQSHDHDGHDHDGHDHSHDTLDPHFWMDVSRMAQVADYLGDKLAATTDDEQAAAEYRQCADDLVADLEDTDQQIREILADVVAEEPTVMTDHDAYQYFADAYGIVITGIVVPGGSTEAEPSSQAVAELADLLDNAGADAMVTNKMTPNRVMENLARDHGEDVPLVEMYEGGLGGTGSEAETYQEGMLYNANALADALSN